MKKIKLSAAKEDLSRYLQEAEKEEIVITRRGKPVGVLIGFASEDECQEYFFENSPAFLDRVAKARQDLRAGRGTALEDI
ncbi:MAG: type II toxin-antitoxin system Phd/YefM family antitoxin [Gemmataceae bacterium]|nr:type II toxin-antitoxin system Phd/YefM family antitoxin [Gemmataceae bacterium]